MKKLLLILSLIFIITEYQGQECGMSFTRDTLSLPGENRTVEGEYVEALTRNGSSIRLLVTDDRKIFLRMMVTENFYFNKVDVLEIQSGSKSYYVKNCRQHKLSKTQGLFVTELYSNYLITLKEWGITGIVFAQAETHFNRKDAAEVKKIATCALEALAKNK
jgi:hypothetical protein